MSLKELALKHTYTCFFNSLLREINFYSITDKDISLDLTDKKIILGLKRSSLVGRHEYTGKFLVVTRSQSRELSFFEAVDELLPQLFRDQSKDNSELGQVFKRRLMNSFENMVASLKARQGDILKMNQEPLTFEEAEQSLFVGHNFHPYPKMREGFNESDYQNYSPEMGGKFKLLWLGFKADQLVRFQASQFKDNNWTATLARFDQVKCAEGMIPVPFHPWQYNTLTQKKRLDGISFEILGEGENYWHPTSSLRSLYSPGAPYMLKYSLTVKLTNSIRHLTDVEVIRGMQVYDVLASKKGQEFSQKHPEFEVIAEPAYVGLRDTCGNLMNDTLIVARVNPFGKESRDNIVVSTLAQDNPLGERNMINHYTQKLAAEAGISPKDAALKWFREYLRVAVTPLVDGQSNFGFLLGAHQQNLILQMKHNLPVKGYFRDCQGTGYNPTGYEFYKNEVPSMTKENGNILGDMGNILFAYYLIINSSFNVIAALAQDGSVSEEELLTEMKTLFLDLRRKDPLDSSFLNYILDSKTILQKGNFFCSLDNINENTTTNPLALYNEISNPLFVGDKNASI